MIATRVLIADDQYVTRRGLTVIVQNSPDLNLAGEAYDAKGAVKAAVKLAPDVVLVNLRTLELEDLQVLVDEISRVASVIFLHAQDSRISFPEALHANVAGFADICVLGGELTNLIELVRQGLAVYIMDQQTLSMAKLGTPNSQITVSFPPWLAALTAREVEVVSLMASGMSNNQIATKICVTESTVKKHASRIMRKMGVSSRLEAALQFSRCNLDSSPDLSVPVC